MHEPRPSPSGTDDIRAPKQLDAPGADHAREVFVSYSHKNKAWIEQLGLEKDPQTFRTRCRYWIDSKRLRTGDRWTDEVDEAIARADAAVLVVSSEFARSKPIIEKELPALGARHRSGLRLVCVPIGRLTKKDRAIVGTALGIAELDELLAVQPWQLPLPKRPGTGRRSDLGFEDLVENIRHRIGESIDSPEIAMLRPVLQRRHLKLERPLGSGPSTRTLIVRDTHLDRLAAIKYVRRQDLTEVFDASVRKVSRVGEHPNFVSIYGAWLDAEPHCYIEQYVEGGSLRDHLDKAGRGLPIDFAQHVLRAVGEAIHYANGRGLPNLNIKPQNILLDGPDGPHRRVLLCTTNYDVNMLSHASGHELMGSGLAYLPPESFAASLTQSPHPERVAQYRLGVVGLEMLVGAHRFADLWRHHGARGGDGPSVRWPAVQRLRADCPDLLAHHIDRMVEVEAHRRFDSIPDALRGCSRLNVAIELAKDSYRRITRSGAGNQRFFRTFYRRFLDSCPEAERMFAERGFPARAVLQGEGPADPQTLGRWHQQFVMLQEAVLLLLAYASLGETQEPTILSRIADTHAAFPPDHYRTFRDALVATVLEIEDERHHAGLASAWEQTLQPGLDYLADSARRRR
ncbi:MAG: TIR domain-containing protein [Planctomycetes bacterium]|nr:TIR domain-containing protein [Planctomycetota bacterium]